MMDLVGLVVVIFNVVMLFFFICIIFKLNKALTIYLRKNDSYYFYKYKKKDISSESINDLE